MRTMRSLLVLLVAFAALACALAATAAAAPGLNKAATHSAQPAQALDNVTKKAWMLPGSSYPWVQPIWIRHGTVTVVIAPRATSTIPTQPASVPIA